MRQAADLSALYLNFVLKYAIRKVQVCKMGFKFNGIHQILFYADDINLLETK
jgi:hypothetical protein